MNFIDNSTLKNLLNVSIIYTSCLFNYYSNHWISLYLWNNKVWKYRSFERIRFLFISKRVSRDAPFDEMTTKNRIREMWFRERPVQLFGNNNTFGFFLFKKFASNFTFRIENVWFRLFSVVYIYNRGAFGHRAGSAWQHRVARLHVRFPFPFFFFLFSIFCSLVFR